MRDLLHRAKEIIGAHHADLSPIEQEFYSRLDARCAELQSSTVLGKRQHIGESVLQTCSCCEKEYYTIHASERFVCVNCISRLREVYAMFPHFKRG
jgi:hypothetical protein